MEFVIIVLAYSFVGFRVHEALLNVSSRKEKSPSKAAIFILSAFWILSLIIAVVFVFSEIILTGDLK